MSYDVRDYHTALTKITAAPLTLTEDDFSVLEAFNPADERRGRDAQRRAQLAMVANREAIQTTSIAPARVPMAVRNDALARGLLQAAKEIGSLKVRLAELERREAGQTAAVAELRKSLIDAKAAVLALENPRPDPPIDFSRGIQH